MASEGSSATPRCGAAWTRRRSPRIRSPGPGARPTSRPRPDLGRRLLPTRSSRLRHGHRARSRRAARSATPAGATAASITRASRPPCRPTARCQGPQPGHRLRQRRPERADGLGLDRRERRRPDLHVARGQQQPPRRRQRPVRRRQRPVRQEHGRPDTWRASGTIAGGEVVSADQY